MIGSLGRVSPFVLRRGSPLDRSHPLASGLIGLWAGIETTSGGRSFFDLADGFRHATLTANTLDPAWRATPFPQIHAPILDGGSGRLAIGVGPIARALVAANATACTVAALVRPSALATVSGNNGLLIVPINLGTQGLYLNLQATGSPVTAQVRFIARSVSTDAAQVVSTTGLNAPVSTWIHAGGSVDWTSKQMQAGFNGRWEAAATRSFSNNSLTLGSLTNVEMIGAQTSSQDWFAGQIAAVAVWSRRLNAAEWWEWHQLATRGFPGVLLRGLPVASSQSGRAFYFRRNILNRGIACG